MNYRFFLVGLALSAGISLGWSPNSRAQSPSASPSSSPPPLSSDGSPSAAMTYPDGSGVQAQGRSGRFPLVAAGAGQSINLQLRFAGGAASTGLIVQNLDGGNIPATQINSTIAADGTASFQFQTGGKPGLYRVLINQGGSVSLLQFWVLDPTNAAANPPTVQPSAGN
jgi:hypothetical protein